MSKGLFIMIEGTDGSGKTTQTELLVNRLKEAGHAVESISFPQYGTPSAAMVEEYLNGKFGTAQEVGPYRASIFYAIDRYAGSFTIRTWLDAGTIVIANRYVGSNMGHQGGKISDPVERGHYFDWNYQLEYTMFGIPKPDVNIILHMPAEMAQALVDKKGAREYLHGKKRDIHEDDIRHLKDAELAYLDMAKRFPEFNIIECTEGETLLSKEQIHESIWATLQSHM
ncbi:MAG TPA: thymidylate kinase [Candidatus Kapabacteria bacterium]|nr:thymidylate kinase [Candidatus Kapabacteria bacterium]